MFRLNASTISKMRGPHGDGRIWQCRYVLTLTWRSSRSCGNAVGIATGCEQAGWVCLGSSDCMFKNLHFSLSSRSTLETTQHPIQWVMASLSLRVKKPELEANQSPPTIAEIRKTSIYTSEDFSSGSNVSSSHQLKQMNWWRKRHVPPKGGILQELHGVTSRKASFFIATVVTTSNLT
jgi:hypothetical protein